MTFPGSQRGILCGMNRHAPNDALHARRAFTLIEVLVALVLMGAASAALAGTLTADRRLRDLSAVYAFAADRARERMELLAALPCSSDTAGTTASPWGSERWRASPSGGHWSLTDSLVLRRMAAPVVIEAHVACPG
jgi:prepilin-type N-terminal cleavage/methylation domain-containing protein